MAVIAKTSMTGSGQRVVTTTTLGSSDTFTYTKGDILILENATAGALTPLIDGADGTTVAVPGLGNVSVAAGLTLTSIGAGVTVAIPLDTISAYCQGNVTVTGGSGIKARLLTFA